MNRLRLNPATGRVAERTPSDANVQDGKTWLTWSWEGGLNVSLLSDADVADWPEVVVTPRPPAPEYAFAVACDDCDGSLAASPHERDRLDAAQHGEHRTAPYAVRVRHPAHQEGSTLPTFAAGTKVTFHGSTTDEAADLVAATIDHADRRDVDGEPTDGYVVTVRGRGMFVPATAVQLA